MEQRYTTLTPEILQARPIVLIHGFPFSHEMWSPQIAFLEKKLRVIAYDVRGHGKSDVGDGQYTLELFVDDLIGLLDHLKIEKAVLCGLSMGGYIALRAIERNPERWHALVLCDTSSQADSNEAKLRRAATIRAIKREGVKPFADTFLESAFAQTAKDAEAETDDEEDHRIEFAHWNLRNPPCAWLEEQIQQPR